MITDFKDISASTNTFVVSTNVGIDIDSCRQNIVVTKCEKLSDRDPVTKRRVTIFKIIDVDPVPTVSIISMKWGNVIVGVDPKRKPTRWFPNSLTLTVLYLDRAVNVKVSSNGKFQMTGCKDHYCIPITLGIYGLMAKHGVKLTWKREPYDKIEAFLIPCLRNIDFEVGFIIDREKLHDYIQENTPLRCLPDTLGHTGVNIKDDISAPVADMPVHKLLFNYQYDDTTTNGREESALPNENDPIVSLTTYREFLSHLTPKERAALMSKRRYSTFLVFQTGKIILSTMNEESGRAAYTKFIDTLLRAREEVELKIEI